MVQVLADMLVPLDNKLTKGNLRLAMRLILVLDYYLAELIGLFCLVVREKVVIDDERVERLLHSHHDELRAKILVRVIVKALWPSWVAVKDWHQILVELFESLSDQILRVDIHWCLRSHVGVEFGETMVQLEIADELEAWELVSLVWLCGFHLFLEDAHDFLALRHSQLLDLAHAYSVCKLIHESPYIQLFLAEVVNHEVYVLEFITFQDFVFHESKYSQRESNDDNDAFDEEEIPHDKVNLLRQIYRE